MHYSWFFVKKNSIQKFYLSQVIAANGNSSSRVTIFWHSVPRKQSISKLENPVCTTYLWKILLRWSGVRDDKVYAAQSNGHGFELYIGSRQWFLTWHTYWLVPGSGLESDLYKLQNLVSQSSYKINMFKLRYFPSFPNLLFYYSQCSAGCFLCKVRVFCRGPHLMIYGAIIRPHCPQTTVNSAV